MEANATPKIKVFLSYSWDSDEHRAWVRHLAEELTKAGVVVAFDAWNLVAGDSATQFMEQSVEAADFVIPVFTPQYASKSNERKGGVGYEQQIVSGQLLSGVPRSKFIPILRSGTRDNAVPTQFGGTVLINFTNDDEFDNKLEDLLRAIYEKPRYAPPALGVPPTLETLTVTLRPAAQPLFSSAPPVVTSKKDEAITAIETARPDQAYKVRRFMEGLVREVIATAPAVGDPNIPEDERLYQALAPTIRFVEEVAEVAEIISGMNSTEAALALYKGFEPLLTGYTWPLGAANTVSRLHSGYYKFLTHELFVTFIAALMAQGRFEIVDTILSEHLYVDNGRSGNPQMEGFHYISQHTDLFQIRNNRLESRRVDLRSDLLNERHSVPPLKDIAPMDSLVAADYFMYLRAAFMQSPDAPRRNRWIPWTALYMGYRAPRFLVEARTKRGAERLLKPLGVGSIEELRTKYQDVAPNLQHFWPNSMDLLDYPNLGPMEIGSQ